MKIVIFGSSGLLGSYISTYLSENKNFTVIDIMRKDIDIVSSFNSRVLEGSIKEILTKHSPDYIVNCCGITDKTDPNIFIVNSYFPIVLSKISESLQIKMIHPSTDCVFSGTKGKYKKEDIPDATDNYGLSKIFADTINCCIIRSSIIGNSFHKNRNNLLDWAYRNNSKEIKGYLNQYWNGVTCLEYAKVVEEIITDKIKYWKGIKHIGSSQPCSKYIILNMYRSILSLNYELTPVILEQKIRKDLFLDIKRSPISQQLLEQKAFNLSTKWLQLDTKSKTESLQLEIISPITTNDSKRLGKYFDSCSLGENDIITDKEDVIICVFSAINPSKNPFYGGNKRSIFTNEERLQQTIKQVEDIRKHLEEKKIKGKILLLEHTKLEKEQKEKLLIVSNYLISFHDREEFDYYINQHPNKSLGEMCVTKFILSYFSNKEYKNFVKISGRYGINETFDINNYISETPVFKKSITYNNVVYTVVYSIPKNTSASAISIIEQNISPYLSTDIEHILYDFSTNYQTKYIDNLGITGYVTDGTLFVM